MASCAAAIPRLITPQPIHSVGIGLAISLVAADEVELLRAIEKLTGQVLPRVGRLVSGHGSAYSYLPDSVAHFPVEEELAALLGGPLDVTRRALAPGGEGGVEQRRHVDDGQVWSRTRAERPGRGGAAHRGRGAAHPGRGHQRGRGGPHR